MRARYRLALVAVRLLPLLPPPVALLAAAGMTVWVATEATKEATRLRAGVDDGR